MSEQLKAGDVVKHKAYDRIEMVVSKCDQLKAECQYFSTEKDSFVVQTFMLTSLNKIR